MKTKKQEDLVNSYLSEFGGDVSSLYREIALYLSELGYNPRKEKSSISFKHDLHSKQIAKMGTNVSKKTGKFPFFSLRFSACRGYSQRFADVVRTFIEKYPTRAARCTGDGCNWCKGEPDTHVYAYTFPEGETKSHCGAYAIEIPDIKVDDIAEIKRLIKEEHDYLLAHEAK